MSVTKHITQLTNHLISVFVLLTILILIVFVGYNVSVLGLDMIHFNVTSILHDIVLIIILIKAYRVLMFYYRKHHISIKYVMEIAIIAPAMELIFAVGNQSLAVNMLFGVFSLGNLILYLVYYEKITLIDEKERKSSEFEL